MARKFFSMLLALVMVLSLLPTIAFATDLEALLEGKVYISISDDQNFITDINGNPMGFVAVPLEELLRINLADYRLEDYIYDADGDGISEITALHLYIYVHEFLLGLDWMDVSITGSPGSIYLAGGLFGFSDENLRYDVNGSYPVDEDLSAENGYLTGATADRIVLSNGDFVNVAHYSNWNFYGDSATGFHYFTDANGNLQHIYQAAPGEPLELGFVRTYSDWSGSGVVQEIGYEIYYGRSFGNAEGMVYSTEEGKLEITFPEAGTWYVWASGAYGNEFSDDVVSAPAFATVKVPDLRFALDLSEVTEPIYFGGIVYGEFVDETAEAGKMSQYDFTAEDYGFYIIYVDFYMDSAIVGFNVNGESYFMDDPDNGINDWDLGNDVWAGYGLGYEDDDGREFAEFYLHLGVENIYNTPGNWVIEPLQITEAVIDALDAIWLIYDAWEEITLESGDDIRYATRLYNGLSDMEKEVLAYLDFEAVELLTAAQDAYEALMGDLLAADEVAALIDEIGEVTLEKEAQIGQVREAFETLTDGQKDMVSNLDVLITAEETLAQLQMAAADQKKAEEAEEAIAAIGNVTVFSEKKIKAARDAYDALTDSQKALVKELAALEAAEAKLQELYAAAAQADHEKIFKETADYISQLGTPVVGSTGGEWMVIDLTRAGLPCPEGYYENVVTYVQNNINDKEQLHRNKSTDNSRVILGLTAAGYDVTDVDGHNLLMGLTDMTYVPRQGINGPIWALIAFDSYNYGIPVNPNAAEQTTREKLITYILDKQLADGGWDLSNRSADPDMTGMAIQALAPYYDTNEEVKIAVDKALACLSDKQHANGGFGSIDGVCAESSAQVVVALTALGIDPERDSRFVKNGISVLDAMCLFAVEGGGFSHVPGDSLNGMATEQSQYALTAYFRFKEGKTSLYNMTDVILRSNNTGVGRVENITSQEDNACAGALDVSAGELANKLLMEEEEKMVESGVDIIIDLDVEDITENVSAAEQALVEKALDNNTVGLYLDITLTKQLGSSTPMKITQTNSPVTVTILLPEALRNAEGKAIRTYKVIRVHEGKTDVLPASYDAATGRLSFATDAFSTYAVVYKDTPVPTNPETADAFDPAALMIFMVVSVGCMAALVLYYKRKYAK